MGERLFMDGTFGNVPVVVALVVAVAIFLSYNNPVLKLGIVALLLFDLVLPLASYAEEQAIRPPAVAGTFYPADEKELSEMVDQFLASAPAESVSGEIVALISPHAGYIYSGQIAAYGYGLIKDQKFDSVILIGPSHHASFQGASIWQEGVWETPLGEVPMDTELAKAIASESPLLQISDEPHLPEHSLETQVPFLQKIFPDLKIVPILLSYPSHEDARLVAHAVVKHIKGKKVLIVASTDMSHYHPQEKAVPMDTDTLRLLEEQRAEELMDGLTQGKNELCGGGAVLAVLEIAKLLGDVETKVLKYATSGDVTGDQNQVVGYSSSVLYRANPAPTPSSESEAEGLSASQQKELLGIARQTLEGQLRKGEIPEFQPADPALLEKRGVFVTLKKHGELRGCIGHMLPKVPLHEAVRETAVASALADARFQPVTKEELKDIEIEISVLTPPRRVSNADEIELGRHGVILKQGENSGVFLPQVAEETSWTKEEFLNELASQKAGLAPEAWKDAATELYVFEAQIFSEKDTESLRATEGSEAI